VRSRGQYIITKDEVHSYANHWLSMSLKLEYEGTNCTASTLLQARFLGRKVYLGAMVVLIAAMQQGAAPRRVRELSWLIGVNRNTISRWQVVWREHFPQSSFWKVARARLVPVFQIVNFPLSLFEAFVRFSDDRHRWGNLLCFPSA